METVCAGPAAPHAHIGKVYSMTRKRSSKICGVLLILCCLLFPVTNRALGAGLGYSEDLLRGCDRYGNTNTETSFGSVAADAARVWCGADVALLPSEDFGTNLQPGEVTDESLAACLQRDSELAAVDMTSAQLCRLLEIGFSHVVVADNDTIDRDASYFAGYLQISGLQVIYDAAAPVGERLYRIELEDGTPVDREDETTSYRVVSTRELLLGAYGYPAFDEEELESAGTERVVVAAYFRNQGSVGEPSSRVRIYGTRDWVFNHRTIIVLILFVVCLVIAQLMRKKKQQSDLWRSSRTATAQEVEEDEGEPEEPPSRISNGK